MSEELKTAEQQEQEISSQLSMRRLILPVLLGLAAAGWLMWRTLDEVKFVQVSQGQTAQWEWVDGNANGTIDFSDPEDFAPSETGTYLRKTSWQLLGEQEFDAWAVWALVGALLMVILREAGYTYRMRVLTDKQLSWKQSFQVVMLWEFSSALTPSVVGGSGVAIYFLNKEGLNLGKATATIFVTAMMDELFYILSVPIVFLLIGGDALYPADWSDGSFGQGAVQTLFYLGYGFIVLLTLTITSSLFLFPRRLKRLLMRLFSLPILRRWRKDITQAGQEIEIASVELKGRPASYWVKAMGSTVLSWTARFVTLNFIIMAFVGPINHGVVYGRQMVMWVIMLISPTPGSSGVAEYFFSIFFADIVTIGAQVLLIALLWRFLTYFIYLIMGALILPRWYRRVQRKKASTAAG
ncbi:MAG: lysylphosphatidylglycerol synthase transmembrane domain-containing protein [Flavobacteriales bacterium]